MRISQKPLFPDDEELKAPAHDELCFWVSDHWRDIVRSIGAYEPVSGSVKLEPTVEEKYKPPVFPDAIISAKIKYTSELLKPLDDNPIANHALIIVECKPKIISFGETIRQLKLYLVRVSHSNWRIHHESPIDLVLVTPDTRYDEYFERENIHVIHPSNVVEINKETSTL